MYVFDLRVPFERKLSLFLQGTNYCHTRYSLVLDKTKVICVNLLYRQTELRGRRIENRPEIIAVSTVGLRLRGRLEDWRCTAYSVESMSSNTVR